MEEFEQLIKGWKKISFDAAIENKNFYLNKNNSIMESIINYEQNEKEEKKKQITLMFISIGSLIFSFSVWIYLDDIKLDMTNLFGALLLLSAFAISLFTNKTDDFPDARFLDSRKYLLALKENVGARKKRNTIFAFVSLAIVLPGLFLLLHNIPFPGATEFVSLNYLILFFALAGFCGGFYFWRKKYAIVTEPMLDEIDSMLEDL